MLSYEEEQYTFSLYSPANQDLTQCIMEVLKGSNLASFLKEGTTLSVKKHENVVRVSYQEGNEMFPTRDEIVNAKSFLNASELLSDRLK